MSPAIRFSLGAGVVLLGYTGAVSQHTLQHRQACGATPEFSAGGADAILKENLKNGDVIIFSRRWYNYHAPQALAIKLYQLIHDTPYDHIGVVVTDKYGSPYIFEQTFFHGYRIRPFESRILYSRAHQITAIMLMPRDDDDPVMAANRTAKLDNFVSRAIARSGSVSGWYSDFKSFIYPSSPCGNLQLLRDVYQCLDMDIIEKSDEKEKKGEEKTRLDCKSLLQRQICVQEKKTGMPRPAGGRYLSRGEVMIRTT